MNVLQILPELNAGGVEATTVEMVEALRAGGHGAHVLSAGGRLVGEIERLGGVHHSAKIGSKNILSVPWRIAGVRRLIAEHQIDIVHARSRAPAWPAMFAAQAEGVAFVTTYHGIYKANNALKRFYNSVMARGDRVIANSNYTRDYLLAQHGTDAEKVTVIPRGVDMARFDPATITSDEINAKREAWSIEDGQRVILLPGRLTRWKGQVPAIAALATLPDHYVLVLLGDAQGRLEYVEELKSTARFYSEALPSRVIMPGHETDMACAYAAADIVICPSLEPEAFGRTAAEAQAMGKPVIATAHGGALETVRDGRTGLLISPGGEDDVARDLAAAILQVENQPLADVGDVARARIAAEFSTASLQAATLKIYETLAAHAG